MLLTTVFCGIYLEAVDFNCLPNALFIEFVGMYGKFSQLFI